MSPEQREKLLKAPTYQELVDESMHPHIEQQHQAQDQQLRPTMPEVTIEGVTE